MNDVERLILEAWENLGPKIMADPQELARRLARRRMASGPSHRISTARSGPCSIVSTPPRIDRRIPEWPDSDELAGTINIH